MRRHRRRSFGVTVVTGVVSAMLLSLSGPVFADDTGPSDPPGSADSAPPAPPAPAGPEQTAQWQAMQTGRPVVVDALTTEVEQTTAEPDGSFRVTSNILPVRVKKGGSWTGVDATLVAAADGTYSTTATPSEVTLSGGGSGPLVTLTDPAGHLLSYTLPFPLPAPSVSGDSAVYANVLPGVDLKATATDQGGFGEVLIVHDAQAAADPALKKLTLATEPFPTCLWRCTVGVTTW